MGPEWKAIYQPPDRVIIIGRTPQTQEDFDAIHKLIYNLPLSHSKSSNGTRAGKYTIEMYKTREEVPNLGE
jgi:hypothetical protein